MTPDPANGLTTQHNSTVGNRMNHIAQNRTFTLNQRASRAVSPTRFHTQQLMKLTVA